jgi:hypothetical protein
VRSGCYELLLRFPDGHEELQLTDHLEHFEHGSDLLLIRGTYWRIAERTEPSLPSLSQRLVCVADSASRLAPIESTQLTTTRSALARPKPALLAEAGHRARRGALMEQSGR